MMKLLHVDSSIRGTESVSRLLTAEIVAGLRDMVPDVEVIYRDLNAVPLPHLTLTNLLRNHPLSLAGSASATESEQAISRAILDDFLQSDTVVIGVPMYNFSVPSQLKTWIDRIVVPGETFSFTTDGVAQGLAGGKRVILAMTYGGLYAHPSPAQALDHGQSYLRSILAFIGIHEAEIVVAEGLQMGPEAHAAALKQARAQIDEMVRATV